MNKIPYTLAKSLITGLVLAFLTGTINAQQTCSDETIMNTTGKWKKQTDANPFPDQSFPKNQYLQVTSRIDKMQGFLQAAYPEPKGIEASWYHSISGNAEVKGGPVPYELDAAFHAYYCNSYDHKLELGGETGTLFFVWANQINSWFAKYIKYYTIHKLPVYLLNKKAGELDGYPVFEGVENGTSNTGTVYSRAIIITRSGQSPYLPVSQKQFLKAFLNYNEKSFQKALAFQKNRAVKTDEEEEAGKKKNLETIERVTMPDKLARAKDNYLRNYKTSKQIKEETTNNMVNNYEKGMKPARVLLADSLKTDLEQPAVLDFNNLLLFKEFRTEDKGGQQLVRLNPDYFDMTLPRYVPQVMIVYWAWDDKKPGNYWKDQIEKNLNIHALKEMIDK